MSDQDLAINQLAADGVPNRGDELAQLFPEAMTDGKVDIEKLKLLLGEKVEDSQERYGLTWPGKRDAIRLAQKQSTATLEPMPDESVDWDTTKNLIIEGDNLEVLKLLQKSYYGQAKLIYIDPPYNTGKDFVYPDNFAEPTESYLARSGQIDGDGFTTSSNRESSGRFHSDWLSMMSPRLSLARNLLDKDGAIFISIDDDEVHNLRLVTDEIFGQENFVSQIVWEKKYTRSNDRKHFSDTHDHLLVYAKQLESLESNLDPRTEKQDAAYRNPDNHPKGPWKATPLHAKSGSRADFVHEFENGVKWQPPKGTFPRFTHERLDEFYKVDAIWFGVDGTAVPSRKTFLAEVKQGVTPTSIWGYGEVGSTHEAGETLKSLDMSGAFDNPKPVGLVAKMLRLYTARDSIILDFFAGSGTTAHAVMAQNAEDGGNRRFILVQLPEATDNPEFPKISDITRERARRAGKKIKEEAGLTGDDLDIGFRAFKLSESNFKNWDADAETLLAEDLEAFVNNINTNANDDGIVHEILLKAGIRLDTDLSSVQVAGQDVTLAAEGLIAVSANRSITQAFIDGLLALEPQVQQVYLLDSGFGDNDSLKVNARHQFAARRSDSNPDKDDALRTV